MTIEFWAPLVDTLEVVTDDGTSIPLVKDERGRFHADHDLPVFVPYRLRVNGEHLYPDPLSEFQPDGVHGPSLRLEHEPTSQAGTWKQIPLKDAIIYELHVGTFSKAGTFLGAIEHLDHLRDLGITHVELMPVSAFPGHRGWGYDGVYLFAPHAPYGSPEDLKELVQQIHARGMSAILDVVFNHFGPDGNYLGHFAPFFTKKYKTPWGQAVNLDEADSDLARETLIGCALHWLVHYGFDALRLDAVHALYDQSATHFLEELARRVREVSQKEERSLVLIAECDLNDPRYVCAVELGGFGLDAQWCDDFHHAVHAFFTGERDGYYEDYGTLVQVKKALLQGYVFDGTWSPHRRRFHGRPPNGIKSDQLVVCAQNHDQVGNRARGERLSSLVGRPQLFQIAALVLLSPFVPLLFQGEEWGTMSPFLYFTDHQDPALGKAVTEGRRHEFASFRAHGGDVPDPQAKSTFESSILAWDELDNPGHREVLNWYKRLIALRSELGPKEAVEVDCDEGAGWLSYRSGSISAYFNFAKQPMDIPGLEADATVLMSYPLRAVDSKKLAPGGTLICRSAAFLPA